MRIGRRLFRARQILEQPRLTADLINARPDGNFCRRSLETFQQIDLFPWTAWT